MYEKELNELQSQIMQTVRCKREDADKALAALKDMQETIGDRFPKNTDAHHIAQVSLYESQGDLNQMLGRLQEAAVCYDEMAKHANLMYQKNSKDVANAYRQGVAMFKQGVCVRLSIRCQVIAPTPRTLNDQEKQAFSVAEQFYKNAIRILGPEGSKGRAKELTMMSNCYMDLCTMYGIIGNYSNALETANLAVKIDKALYEGMDDAAHSMRLAIHMNVLSLIYNLMKNFEMAADTLEDAIYALSEHKGDNPEQFDMTIARFQLNLGSCYQKGVRNADAEDTFKSALSMIKSYADKTGNRYTMDLISAFQATGMYYMAAGNRSEGESYLNNGILLAEEAYNRTNQPLFKSMLDQMRKAVQ